MVRRPRYVPWDSQPQEAVELRRDTEALRAIQHFFPLDGPRDLVAGRLLSQQAGWGVVPTARGLALRGNGSQAPASITLDLSSFSTLSISFWMLVPSYANDYASALEFTGDGLSQAGFFISPNHPAGVFSVGAGGFAQDNHYSRPSAGEWHKYDAVFNRPVQTDSGGVILYVDGRPATRIGGFSGANQTGNYVNDTLYICSRTNSALFLAAQMQNLAIRPGYLLTEHEAAEEYARGWDIYAPRRIYVPVGGGAPALPTLTALPRIDTARRQDRYVWTP